jgi:hypothetical protein
MADKSLQLSKFENGVVGVLSGSIEVCLLQPMLYCKNTSQQKLPIVFNPRIIYRGLAASVGNMALLTGLQFPLAAGAMALFTGGKERSLSSAELVGASFIGGWFSGLACGPIEVVMIQQMRFGGTLFATPSRVMKTYGAASIVRGTSLACGREAFFTAGYMGLAPSISRELQQRFGMSESHGSIFGPIGAGLIASTLSHPLDTAKTCMQGDLGRETYGGVVATLRTLYNQGGMGRIFLGWGWRTGRMMGSFFVLAECKKHLSHLLYPHYFQ